MFLSGCICLLPVWLFLNYVLQSSLISSSKVLSQLTIVYNSLGILIISYWEGTTYSEILKVVMCHFSPFSVYYTLENRIPIQGGNNFNLQFELMMFSLQYERLM
jgi:hypothetical protein